MQLSGVIEARQVAQFRHRGHRHGELDAAQGLEGLDHGREAPGLHLLVEFLFQTLEAFGLFGDGLDVFLKDDLLRRVWDRPPR